MIKANQVSFKVWEYREPSMRYHHFKDIYKEAEVLVKRFPNEQAYKDIRNQASVVLLAIEDEMRKEMKCSTL